MPPGLPPGRCPWTPPGTPPVKGERLRCSPCVHRTHNVLLPKGVLHFDFQGLAGLRVFVDLLIRTLSHISCRYIQSETLMYTYYAGTSWHFAEKADLSVIRAETLTVVGNGGKISRILILVEKY